MKKEEFEIDDNDIDEDDSASSEEADEELTEEEKEKKQSESDYFGLLYTLNKPPKNFEAESGSLLGIVTKELLDAEHNLDLKSEVHSPYAFSALRGFADYARDLGFIDGAEFIDNMITYILRFYYSKDRKSRNEIIELGRMLSGMDEGMSSNLDMQNEDAKQKYSK